MGVIGGENMGKEIFDKPSTLEKRRDLKKNQTESEIIMWDRLRAKRFKGIKFRRQYGIGEYIIDFYSSKLMLAIEIDGNQHVRNVCLKDNYISNYWGKTQN